VRDAIDKGARAAVGGRRRAGPGDFYEPTLLVDVDHSMECMTEETFGPTLPVMKVRDADEAVRLANDSPYGLQASVWTKDRARGEHLARMIEAGVVCVNDAQVNYVALELPMGGWKESGLGSRHGADGIRKYTKKQALLVTRFAPKRDLHMLPYKERTTRMLERMLRFVYGRGKRR
jgi:acyl-CoA reductase-like NAD-dependent aldehyde dehydrogenase